MKKNLSLFEKTNINLSKEAVCYYKNQVVLITGAAGFIGSEIARYIAKTDFKRLILLDQSESGLYNLQQEFLLQGIENVALAIADIRDKNSLGILFKKFQPNIVFHAAAYKHVHLMEDFPKEAINTNVEGTKNVVDVALELDLDKLIFISTDKAVNPVGVMGASKRLAELYIGALNSKGVTKFVIVRFGNVVNSSGSVIPLFKKQIANGGPVTITHKNMKRFFMSASEACVLVLEAGAMGNGGEIYVFDMGEPIKIYDLAKHMIQQSGLKYPNEITISFTGVRLGEKITEAIMVNGENAKPTNYKKIWMVQERRKKSKKIKEEVERLCLLNKSVDIIKLITLIKKIIPEFSSKNPKFEDLNFVKPSVGKKNKI